MKLNETAVLKLPPPATGYTLFRYDDMTGFAVRVTSKGAKSFVLGYTVDGGVANSTRRGLPSGTAVSLR